MPEFANPFQGITPGRKLSMREVTRAIRLSIAAEEEAVHIYEAIADATDNELVRVVLQDVANEEREHVGEFQYLLNVLLPDERDWLKHGAEEVAGIRARLTGQENAEADLLGHSIPTIGNMRKEEGDV